MYQSNRRCKDQWGRGLVEFLLLFRYLTQEKPSRLENSDLPRITALPKTMCGKGTTTRRPARLLSRLRRPLARCLKSSLDSLFFLCWCARSTCHISQTSISANPSARLRFTPAGRTKTEKNGKTENSAPKRTRSPASSVAASLAQLGGHEPARRPKETHGAPFLRSLSPPPPVYWTSTVIRPRGSGGCTKYKVQQEVLFCPAEQRDLGEQNTTFLPAQVQPVE